MAFIYLDEIPENILSSPNVGFATLPQVSDASIGLIGKIATISGYGDGYIGGFEMLANF